jgi:hypothetical protein
MEWKWSEAFILFTIAIYNSTALGASYATDYFASTSVMVSIPAPVDKRQ